jgi:type I restriction enzyme S subunit
MKSKWATKKLGDKEYFEILGSGIERFEGEKEYLSTSSIEGNKIIAPECKITYQKRPSRANMQPRLNSVWFARMVNTIKVYSFTEVNKEEVDKYILSTGFAGILCKPEKVDPRYLEKIFLSKWFNDLKDSLASDKAIQKSLNNDDIANLEIPLPPLPIQQKVVKILDTIQEAIDIQDKIIEKTKELKKSLMAELFKYGAPSFRKGRKLKKTEIGEIPEDWEVVRLEEVVNDLINGFPTGERDENGILQLRMDSITSDGKINLEAGVKVPRRIGIENYFLREGDILFNNTNSIDLVGKTALFRGEFKECVFSNHLTRIRVDLNKTLPEWVFYILFRNWELKLFKNLATRRVGQADINRNVLKNLKLPLPPLPEQKEIAEILQTVDQKIDIERRKKELYEELFKTMLNKIMNQEIDLESLNF